MGPTLLVIFGPPAVGKATVGAEVAARSGFKLFHNHVSLDVVTAVFDWGTPQFAALLDEIRRRFMEEAAASGTNLIFTFVWALEDPADRAIIDGYVAIFEAHGGRTLFVELVADQPERMARNNSEPRNSLKRRTPESRTAEWIARIDSEHALNSVDGFFYPEPERYLRIENTVLSPGEAAGQIVAHFGLEQ